MYSLWTSRKIIREVWSAAEIGGRCGNDADTLEEGDFVVLEFGIVDFRCRYELTLLLTLVRTGGKGSRCDLRSEVSALAESFGG